MAKPDRLKKEDFLRFWKGLTPNQKIKPQPVPYKHTGTTYHEDGIRITGSKQFVDSVLSRFQDLLAYENNETRLDVNYTEATGKTKDKSGKTVFTNKGTGTYVAYIKVAERGHEAKIMRTIYGSND